MKCRNPFILPSYTHTNTHCSVYETFVSVTDKRAHMYVFIVYTCQSTFIMTLSVCWYPHANVSVGKTRYFSTDQHRISKALDNCLYFRNLMEVYFFFTQDALLNLNLKSS